VVGKDRSPYDGNADRVASSAVELHNLVSKITDYPVNLLDHRLRENLHCDADFNRCYRSACNEIAIVNDRDLAWDDLSERAISAPGGNSMAPVLDVENPVFPIDDGRDQLGRAANADEVFVEVHRDEVTLIRTAMLVDLTFKQMPECRQ
jgi:hypothetical protein